MVFVPPYAALSLLVIPEHIGGDCKPRPAKISRARDWDSEQKQGGN